LAGSISVLDGISIAVDTRRELGAQLMGAIAGAMRAKPTPEELAMLRSDEERCETCVFWLRDQGARTDLIGVCRRYPPHPKGYCRRTSPNHMTSDFRWCGEWRDAATHGPSRVFREAT